MIVGLSADFSSSSLPSGTKARQYRDPPAPPGTNDRAHSALCRLEEEGEEDEKDEEEKTGRSPSHLGYNTVLNFEVLRGRRPWVEKEREVRVDGRFPADV